MKNIKKGDISSLKELSEFLLESMPGYTYWFDTDEILLGCSLPFAQLAGHENIQSIIGKNIYVVLEKIIDNNDSVSEIRKEDKVILSHKSGRKEFFAKSRNKNLTFLLERSPIVDSDGKILGAIVSGIDITKQVKKENELRQKLDRIKYDVKTKDIYLHNILCNLPEHFYWTDLNSVVLGCNDQQAKNFGFKSREDLIGKSVLDAAEKLGWPKSFAEEAIKNDMKVIASKQEVVTEEKAKVGNEEKTYLAYKRPLLDDDNQVIGIFGVSIDITDRKKMEQLRLEKEAAEERAETTKLIAASMAHELRTPLRAIDAGVEGVQHYLPDLIKTYEIAKQADLEIPYIPASDYKQLDTISKETQNETKAVFNIIDMLLIKADLSNVDKKDFQRSSIKLCLNEAIERYHFDIGEKEKVHVKDFPDFEFFGDPLLVSHVIFNLMQNALYFIKAASKGEILIWAGEEKGYNVLHFKDTGKGVPSSELPKIFDRFYTTTTHGTGVGLAFCKLVMESMGGSIKCHSNEGEYTEFVLKFPANLPSAPGQAV